MTITDKARTSGIIRPVDWIAADWGTSRLRLWAMADDGTVVDRRSGNEGAGGLEPDGFEPVLERLTDGWSFASPRTEVIVCGMAGARGGWTEVDYATCPAAIRGTMAAKLAPVRSKRFIVRIIAGLKQLDPPDVMRGEETQIAGLLADEPGFAGLVILPGTHSKWARVENGEVKAFFTMLTGELYELIARHSILRRSLDQDRRIDFSSFDQAVASALAAPAGFSRRLFGLRARALLDGLTPAGVRAALSGELIGIEIADRLGETGPDVDIAIVGTEDLARLYARALAIAGRRARLVAAEELTLKGLCLARKGLIDA